jgi:hypothetical protein
VSQDDSILPGVALGYDIYPDIGLLFFRGQGEIPHSEKMRVMLAWLRDSEYQCCTAALIDFAGVRTIPRVGG